MTGNTRHSHAEEHPKSASKHTRIRGLTLRDGPHGKRLGPSQGEDDQELEPAVDLAASLASV
jgi:hypothetical protein